VKKVFPSIRAKMDLVFLGFMLLVMGSVIATYLSVRAQAADALVINLAGRQRMLTQAISKAALGVAGGRASEYQEELSQAVTLFDRTLAALLDGGEVPYGDRIVALPGTADSAIRDQLEAVRELWVQLRDTIANKGAAGRRSRAFSQRAMQPPFCPA
jgi:hypothetical protein